MKKVIQILRQYLLVDIPLKKTIGIILLCGVWITIEYTFKLKKEWLNSFYWGPYHSIMSFIYYGIPFISGLVYLKLYQKNSFKITKEFVALILLTIIAFVIRSSFRFHFDWFTYFVDERFNNRIANYLFLGPLWILLPIVWFYKDRKSERLYGLSIKNVSWSAYGLMLLAMIPLIIGASFLPDFIAYYPKAANAWSSGEVSWTYYALFEALYGLDFFYVEFFFRGFMVMALARYMGKDAILATAVFYCSIHFGKPLGETISSIFGALILGSLAYETRSILGGIMVHVGIAWLMELGGYLGRQL